MIFIIGLYSIHMSTVVKQEQEHSKTNTNRKTNSKLHVSLALERQHNKLRSVTYEPDV